MSDRINVHTDLEMYQKAFDAAMRINQVSLSLPKEEANALTNQIRRSSRSVCANIAEAWCKRRYEKALISKLTGAEGECADTQVCLQFVANCGYVDAEYARELCRPYDGTLPTIVGMINLSDTWIIRKR